MQAQLLHFPRVGTRTGLRPFADLARRIADWLHHRATRRSLVRLDERTLKDVGLTRADVDREYDRPFWEPVDHAALELIRRRAGPRLGG